VSASKYVKKPVVIEAWQFVLGGDEEAPTSGNAVEIAQWCDGAPMGTSGGEETPTYWIEIATLEGVMKATPNDFIIKGVAGEFYACKPDIFEASYEAVID
jgi:hypothetical protein